ncbi:LysR family transcriptional regulator [Oscillatoria sp. CS-180]|uniref:LysR family transcriptional regulator n=1 Tax=Oscillatoria sp. CS-180 TaxID=3021720 RepID=UPI00232B2EB3|nr:LysR family transcriptional regulator [Oscillatoria sp. CS-180]MDB9527325.1 LysR family transcriptional regulator [Oscillatoria sp. CS-180]
MNIWKLKLSQLRALLAVAKYGNFSEAALQLDVTQSTISHAIATLEDELGVVLFLRGRHGAQLTPVGERILNHAQQIKGLLESMMLAADDERGLKGGTVRIATFRSIATHVLPEAIARLHQLYPTIQISLIELDELYQLRQALNQGQVDICVAEMLNGDEFEAIHILDDDYIALLPPQYGLRDAQLTKEDLYKYPLITSSHDSCSGRMRDCLKELDKPLEVTYRIRHDSSMASMVQQGLGIALMTELSAKPVPEGVRVCRLPFPASRPIGATLLKDALHSPAIYAFLDALREMGEFSAAQAI